MEPPWAGEWVQRVALWGAFWVAVVCCRRGERSGLALGLACGAVLAHLGWLALHADRTDLAGLLRADPLRGFSVLFVPLGPAAVAVMRRRPARRRRLLIASARSLPLALAVARAGCLVVGCCGGVPIEHAMAFDLDPNDALRAARPASWRAHHPVAVYEIVGWVALHGLVARAPRRFGVAVFAAGFGSLRLAVEPWRASAALGAPLWPVESIAVAWIGAGLWLGWSSRHQLPGKPPGPDGRPNGPPSDGAPPSSSSFSGRPRTGFVRHILKTPRCRPSRS